MASVRRRHRERVRPRVRYRLHSDERVHRVPRQV